jgi:type IV pilus assembly protein PilC
LSIQSSEIVAFTQQFANLIDAGIPLSSSLSALEKQEENKELRKVIGAVRVAVEGGALLSKALEQHPKVFSKFFVSMVYAGEQGPGLSKVLNRVADHLEKEESLKARVKGVFTYPVVVGVLVILIVIFLVVVVAPVFADVYRQLRISLPWPTQLLLAISISLRRYWWLSAGLAAALYYSYRRLKQGKIGRELLDGLIMNFPILGKLIRKVAAARFVRTFGDMLSCAVPIIESLEIAEKVVGNREISSVAGDLTSSIQTGGKLSEGFSHSDIFPPVVVQMTYAGEESGNLSEMLLKCADNLDRDIEFSSKRMLAVLEPSLTMILAGVVAFIALAIYLPMFDLVGLISQ